MNTTFAEEHEILTRELKSSVTINKIIMTIIIAVIVRIFFEIIHCVKTYEHGDPLYNFGISYSLLFVCVGLYFLFMREINFEVKEYTKKRKELFKKYFNV